ncbi:Wzz/FepE/Etk N-terminal domain-containing protein [Aestuariimicrobium soli]|uniref:Wzz/FepE/Etk N-terminal domain-containing protein n=1 Tax=Aestuariimicrobium soli TaxID=2035834 RepID=UPI003EBCC74F
MTHDAPQTSSGDARQAPDDVTAATAPVAEITIVDRTSADAPVYSDDRALDVLGYVMTLRRFLLPAAVVALVVLALGAVYTLTRPAAYTAEVVVLLVPSKVTTEAEATQQAALLPMVARSYSQMGTSRIVLEPVAKAANDPAVTVETLAARVSVGYPANSLLLRFSVSGTDPTKTAALANQVADSYVTHVGDFGPAVGNSVSLGAKVIDRPATPLTPLASTKPQLAAASVIGALVVGLLTAVALDVVSRRRRQLRSR